MSTEMEKTPLARAVKLVAAGLILNTLIVLAMIVLVVIDVKNTTKLTELTEELGEVAEVNKKNGTILVECTTDPPPGVIYECRERGSKQLEGALRQISLYVSCANLYALRREAPTCVEVFAEMERLQADEEPGLNGMTEGGN